MKRTLYDIIVLHLADQAGQWVMGFELEKVNTKYGWIGSSGQRRCRELVEQMTHKVSGIEYSIESRRQGKYVRYRVAGKQDLRPKFREEIRDGQRVMVMY